MAKYSTTAAAEAAAATATTQCHSQSLFN